MNSNAPPRATQSAGCYPDQRKKHLHHQRMMRPTDHLVVVTERPLGPPLKPHPGAALKISRHGEMRQTCEIYWRTRQSKQGRSTDRVGAPRHETVIVTPDTVNSAGPNTVDKAR